MNKSFLSITLMLLFLGITGSTKAQEVKLTLQDAPLTILKDSTTTKKINGVPDHVAGSILLKIKWHAMTLLPNTFNVLKIELMHGSNVKETQTCYSAHSDKTPRCSFWSFTVTQAEADAVGDWKLRVTNSSNNDVNGFNILKEVTDVNPFVSSDILSVFRPDCTPRRLLLTGGRTTISPYTTLEKSIEGIPSRAGEIYIKTKWHTTSLTPNLFHPLKVELMRDGNVVATEEGYSIHAGQKDKVEFKLNKGATTQLQGWKLRITNTLHLEMSGFDIEKGSDANPFVPIFRSTFKPCN